VRAHDLAGTLDSLAFSHSSVGTEQHDTDLTGFEVHAHALDTGSEPVSMLALYMHICRVLACMHTRPAPQPGHCSCRAHAQYRHFITGQSTVHIHYHCAFFCLPDRQDTARLSEAGLLLHAANSLLEDGRDLGGGGLVGIAAGEGVDDGGCGALLSGEKAPC
jgi:hypothetical protein